MGRRSEDGADKVHAALRTHHKGVSGTISCKIDLDTDLFNRSLMNKHLYANPVNFILNDLFHVANQNGVLKI